MSAAAERRFRMSQETIDMWAALSGDHNPLHVSPDHAAKTPFGGTICHGHYSLALMESMMRGIAGEAWLQGGLLSEVRFRSPVRPGRDYVLAAADAGEGIWRLELRDAKDDTLAAAGRAEIAAPQTWS